MRQSFPDGSPASLLFKLFAVMMLLCPCGCFAKSPPAPAAEAQYGFASWHRGAGRTASGQHWNPEELIAAHRSLPMGTIVRVVNLRNGRETTVRITDRGPYTSGRIIDLSIAAARQIDCLQSGVARVRLEVVIPGQLQVASAEISEALASP